MRPMASYYGHEGRRQGEIRQIEPEHRRHAVQRGGHRVQLNPFVRSVAKIGIGDSAQREAEGVDICSLMHGPPVGKTWGASC